MPEIKRIGYTLNDLITSEAPAVVGASFVISSHIKNVKIEIVSIFVNLL